MAEKKEKTLGGELLGTPMAKDEYDAGPAVGEFVQPPEVPDVDEPANALPEQEEFWHPPARFGTVPVEANPLGWDRRRGFRKLYPQVMLPTQVVERISFGHSELGPNRLFWGDNLHVMRQLPSESIDLFTSTRRSSLANNIMSSSATKMSCGLSQTSGKAGCLATWCGLMLDYMR